MSFAYHSDSIWSISSVGSDTPNDLYLLNDSNNYNVAIITLRELLKEA